MIPDAEMLEQEAQKFEEVCHRFVNWPYWDLETAVLILDDSGIYLDFRLDVLDAISRGAREFPMPRRTGEEKTRIDRHGVEVVMSRGNARQMTVYDLLDWGIKVVHTTDAFKLLIEQIRSGFPRVLFIGRDPAARRMAWIRPAEFLMWASLRDFIFPVVFEQMITRDNALDPISDYRLSGDHAQCKKEPEEGVPSMVHRIPSDFSLDKVTKKLMETYIRAEAMRLSGAWESRTDAELLAEDKMRGFNQVVKLLCEKKGYTESAARSRVHRASENDLPRIKVANKYHYRLKDVLAWIEELPEARSNNYL